MALTSSSNYQRVRVMDDLNDERSMWKDEPGVNQLQELESIDRWMAVNTIFTIITGTATLVLAIVSVLRG